MEYVIREFRSHGDGEIDREKFRRIGRNVIFEKGVLIFHPENIEIGDNVYVGHNAFLKGYHKNLFIIGSNTWIGQACFLHSGGGIKIGEGVGIGPCVKILTHYHVEEELEKPILFCDQRYEEVVIEDGCDIGIGAIILPGVTVGRFSIVGAGAVVAEDVKPYSVVAGVPARMIRSREEKG